MAHTYSLSRLVGITTFPKDTRRRRDSSLPIPFTRSSQQGETNSFILRRLLIGRLPKQHTQPIRHSTVIDGPRCSPAPEAIASPAASSTISTREPRKAL